MTTAKAQSHEERAQAYLDEEFPAGDQQHAEHVEFENMEIEEDP